MAAELAAYAKPVPEDRNQGPCHTEHHTPLRECRNEDVPPSHACALPWMSPTIAAIRRAIRQNSTKQAIATFNEEGHPRSHAMSPAKLER